MDVITCNLILKPMVARVRPYDVNTAIELLIRAPRDFSFPSGHTAASFATVAALWFAGEKRLGIPALILAIFIAVSRMYFYVHYPTDVLGGVLLGIACGYVANKTMELWKKKQKCEYVKTLCAHRGALQLLLHFLSSRFLPISRRC